MIPYRSLPSVEVGPLSLHSFGLAAALGFAAAMAVLGRHARVAGLDLAPLRDLALRLGVVALGGARLAYVLSHAGRFRAQPLRAFAVWEGGLQFFGGFAAAGTALWWWLRRRPELPRAALADGLARALVVGVAVGRLGCIAVGEHLGSATSFPLGLRYLGGQTVEGPLVVGSTVHSAALYEALGLAALAGAHAVLRRRALPAGALAVVAGLWYGAQRFLTDFVRAYDTRVGGLTGAQWAALALFSATIVLTVRAAAGRRAPRAAEVPL